MGLEETTHQVQHGFEPVYTRHVPVAPEDPSMDVDDPMDWIEHDAVHQESTEKSRVLDDAMQQDANVHEAPMEEQTRLIIAVDFGTATSTVSYVTVEPGLSASDVRVDKIECIDDYKYANGSSVAGGNMRNEIVPTKLLYLGQPLSKATTPLSSTNGNGDGDAHGDGDDDDGDNYVDDEPVGHDSDVDDDFLQTLHATPNLAPVRNGKKDRRKSNKKGVHEHESETESCWSPSACISVKWGFAVDDKQSEWQGMMEYDEKETVELVKLTLVEDTDEQDKSLKEKRDAILQQIEKLRGKGIVQNRDHVLRDYLARLLLHAKKTFERDGLLGSAKVEYVLCVPVSWSEHACRTMHDAMVSAIQACRLSTLPQKLIPELFIVSEAEAAAQFVVASNNDRLRLRQRDIIIVLDAGGGTVDITTYIVTSDATGPLRLKGEAIKADGALCGSSLITERYLSKLEEKLREIDPKENRDALHAKAVAWANEWDLKVKRRVNVVDKKDMHAAVKYHKDTPVRWKYREIREIFEPSLRGTIKLLDNQLRLARESNLAVDKLILVGGFGESPSLQRRIELFLETSPNVEGRPIDLIQTRWFPGSAIARGAVLRALDKRNGPSRISRSSFGFLRHEEFDEECEAHKGVELERNPIEDVLEVRDTISWVIRVGTRLDSTFDVAPIKSVHSFEYEAKELICREELYVSKNSHESHYQRHHPENEGASLLGHIEIDMSDIKEDAVLVNKKGKGPRTRDKNRYYREITLDLVLEVEGKQLKYEARWPSGATRPEDVRKRVTGYVSLASSLAPGVA